LGSNPFPEAEILTDEFHDFSVSSNKIAYNNLAHFSGNFMQRV